MPEEMYIVVVSIFEGKNFPRRSKHHIVVECTFDGEFLSTDPVDHVETPQFAAELAWEMKKKAIHQHKMQRTPIKLHCFAVDTIKAQRELIGYMLLDLRSAQLVPQEPRWYNLLSRKYPHHKSEIKLRISLERDPLHVDDFKTINPSRTSTEISVKMDEKAKYFQIGSPEKHCNMFKLSVAIKSAANLEQLVPADRRLPSNDAGYFFAYTLLDSNVVEDPFPDLLNPEFILRRTVVRIRSSADTLREFFRSKPGLMIHLCCSEHSLGRASVPLGDLFQSGSEDVCIKPSSIDGAFRLCPPHAFENVAETFERLGAKVGVTINLSREEMRTDSGELMALVRETIPAATSYVANHDGNECSDLLPPDNAHTIDKEVSNWTLEEARHSVTNDVNSSHPSNSIKTNLLNHSVENDSESTNLTTSATRLAIPPQARHYKFSLEVIAIENPDLQNIRNAYFRYSYPFFGSAAPVLISISGGITKGIECKLSRSLCNFDFACTPSLLQNTFNSVPLDIELWSKNLESDDVLIATTAIPLEQLLVQKPVHYLTSRDKTQRNREGVKLSLQVKLGMKAICEPLQKVGGLRVSLCLEDLGSVRQRRMQLIEKRPQHSKVMEVV